MTLAAYGRLVLAAAAERRAAGGRERVPEPMEMNDPASVAAFHAGADDLQAPVYRFNAEMVSRLLPERGTLLDLGSGSGRLVARIARARPDVRIIGTELAENMLATGRAELSRLGLDQRVELRRLNITSVPVGIAPEIDAVSCVWALHHLPTRADAVRCLESVGALRDRHACAIWVFDFARLRRRETIRALLGLFPDADPILRRDALASEDAAWTADELRTMLREAGIADARGGGERLSGQFQAWWAPAEHERSAHERLWAEPDTSGRERVLSGLLRRGLIDWGARDPVGSA